MLPIQDLKETAHHQEKVDPLLMSKIILVTPLSSKQRTYISLGNFFYGILFFFYLGRVQTINALNFFTISFAELQTSMLKFK